MESQLCPFSVLLVQELGTGNWDPAGSGSWREAQKLLLKYKILTLSLTAWLHLRSALDQHDLRVRSTGTSMLLQVSRFILDLSLLESAAKSIAFNKKSKGWVVQIHLPKSKPGTVGRAHQHQRKQADRGPPPMSPPHHRPCRKSSICQLARHYLGGLRG